MEGWSDGYWVFLGPESKTGARMAMNVFTSVVADASVPNTVGAPSEAGRRGRDAAGDASNTDMALTRDFDEFPGET